MKKGQEGIFPPHIDLGTCCQIILYVDLRFPLDRLLNTQHDQCTNHEEARKGYHSIEVLVNRTKASARAKQYNSPVEEWTENRGKFAS